METVQHERPTTVDQRTTLSDRLFRAPNGKIVLAQMPNPPLIGWAVFGILVLVVKTGRVHAGAASLSRALLLTWAYMEIAQGINWFRRILGAVVFVIVAVSYFM